MATERVSLQDILNRVNATYRFCKNGEPVSGWDNNYGPPSIEVLEISGDDVLLEISEHITGRINDTSFRLARDVKALAALFERLDNRIIRGVETISSGENLVTVTFPEPLLDDTYTISGVVLRNLTETPVFLNLVVTSKTPNGFTVSLSAPVSTGGYVLEWIITK